MCGDAGGRRRPFFATETGRELSASRSEAVVAVEFTGAGSPALVRVPTVPEFMGCFMPMKAVEAAAGLPEFVGRREARLSVVGGGKA